MWLALAQTFSNNTCLRLCASLRVVRPYTQTPTRQPARLSNPFKHPFNAAFQIGAVPVGVVRYRSVRLHARALIGWFLVRFFFLTLPV